MGRMSVRPDRCLAWVTTSLRVTLFLLLVNG
jgi:hypothetical protein